MSGLLDEARATITELVGRCSVTRFWNLMTPEYPSGDGVFQEHEAIALVDWATAALEAALPVPDEIVIYEGDEWSAVYLNGRVVRKTVGDSYHADEWLRQHFGVRTVQSEDFFLTRKREGVVADTVAEITEFSRTKRDRADQANRLEADAKALLAQAQSLREFP